MLHEGIISFEHFVSPFYHYRACVTNEPFPPILLTFLLGSDYIFYFLLLEEIISCFGFT
uniref:Uncharacterized protein n=1 Tax=Siphoviridae sp. ctTnV63 TaxID=2825523 RepID=A0A8S5NX69_9CAUD|nr:MAG TPA: hypothetical protein [Siphoviridae sp. ctTnV63]